MNAYQLNPVNLTQILK